MGAGTCGQVDLNWLMKKVRVGAVGIGADWLYYVTVTPDADPVLCDDEVHALEDEGWVVLEPDGPVSASPQWRRRNEPNYLNRAA